MDERVPEHEVTPEEAIEIEAAEQLISAGGGVKARAPGR